MQEGDTNAEGSVMAGSTRARKGLSASMRSLHKRPLFWVLLASASILTYQYFTADDCPICNIMIESADWMTK